MRFSRLVAGTVTAGLLGLTPLALGAPAQATDDVTTTVTLTQSYASAAVKYGDSANLVSSVKDSKGRSAYKGTATLWILTPSAPVWTELESKPSSGFISWDQDTAKGNAEYKVTYSGYAATATFEDNYGLSESAPLALAVQPKVEIKNAKKRLTITGKIGPKTAAKKVKVQIKSGKKWKNFRTVKAKNGKFNVTLPAPKGRGKKLFFKITIPASKDFTSFSDIWYTYTY